MKRILVAFCAVLFALVASMYGNERGDFDISYLDSSPTKHNGISANVEIPYGITELGETAFKDCAALERVTIPKSVKSIVEDVFGWYDKWIQTENGVKYADKWAVGSDALGASVVLRADTTGIADCAFLLRNNLTSVTIPKSVVKIGEGAFENCEQLSEIKFEGTKAQWNAVRKSAYWDEETCDYTIYCADGEIKKE